MRNLLRGRDNGLKHPDLSLHSYHYAPQNHAVFDPSLHLLVTITLSPTDSLENTHPPIAQSQLPVSIATTPSPRRSDMPLSACVLLFNKIACIFP